MNPKFQGPQHDKRRYVKLKHDGASVILDPAEVTDFMDGNDDYEVEDVWMSDAEYEALPEFQGF